MSSLWYNTYVGTLYVPIQHVPTVARSAGQGNADSGKERKRMEGTVKEIVLLANEFPRLRQL